MNKAEIQTPALVVDLEPFESNIARMAAIARQGGKALRPHAKAHKCVEIARRQMNAGAVGICAATVAEAEIMSAAGIPVLLTSPLATPAKMARAVACGAMVVADHPRQVEEWERMAAAAGREIEVLVDLDTGDHRTGATPGDGARAIAEAVRHAPHLRLRGVQAYSVRASHESGHAERKRISTEIFEIARTCGVEGAVLTGGSTATAEIDAAIECVTELQAGSYALMDMQYGRMESVPFHRAMSVWATVISANHKGFVTVDAGFKAFSTDRAYPPEPVMEGASYRWGGDEFGYVSGSGLSLGDRLELVPPHCDPTVNLHDRIYACRGDQVEAIWPVMGRRG